HVAQVKDPCRRRAKNVALEDLDAHHGHQRDNEPSRGLADPRADGIDRVQEGLDAHLPRPVGAYPIFIMQSTIRSPRVPEWWFAACREAVRSASWHSDRSSG